MEKLLAEIDILKTELNLLRETLDNYTIKEALTTEFLYESNRIEGNTLTLRETQLVINEGVTISGKSMREHLEAINHKEAILFVEDIVSKKLDFSAYLLKQIHSLVLYAIDRENTGNYRKVPVLIGGSKHIPPQPYLIESLMEEYFRFYEQNKTVLHPVVLSAEMHEKLVIIYPFIDGNGRTSRLVMNLILLQNGFPLAIIGGNYESRMAYYAALESVQIEKTKSDFILFIAQKVKENLLRYLSIFKKV